MPHLHIEYSNGLGSKVDLTKLVKALHAYMLGSDVFPTAGIRVRAFEASHSIVADGAEGTHFMAMTLSVGAGRSTDTLRHEGDQIFAIAQNELATLLAEPYFALSLEILEINPDLSWKDTPIHRRLSKVR